MDSRCQQFTSPEIAAEMLDLLGYQQDLYGKTVLENSCGEGDILCLVVERYIRDALEQGYAGDDIILGLERDIYGAEIVGNTYERCIENLNRIAAQYGLGKIQWNIFRGDILTFPFEKKFDFVVGNPPYISYRNLDKDVRKFIKKAYCTCEKGKPDYCYAFIENAICYLAENGSMVYLIPNSIYKNVYAQDLRELILRYIEEIRDYPNQKLFENAMTSSAIMLLKKQGYVYNLKYKNIPEQKSITINKTHLTGKWVFGKKNDQQKEMRFGDIFKASMGVATQRNNIFVVNEEKKVKLGLENGVVREAASPRNQKSETREFIIFPYVIHENQVIHYTEEEFQEKYPNAYTYLSEHKKELERRDADKGARWFEYGRSQALQNMNKEKLLVSTVMTDRIYTYNINSEAIPYAGIYIIALAGYDLNIAKRILESNQFLRYIRGIGTPASGRSLRITARDINEFRFRKEDFLDGESKI